MLYVFVVAVIVIGCGVLGRYDIQHAKQKLAQLRPPKPSAHADRKDPQ